MSAKQAIKNKLQGSVATYLRCSGVVNNQIKKGVIAESVWIVFKSVNIWQNYKQERGYLVHVLRLLELWWPGEQSARDNNVLSCKFANYLPINFFSQTDLAINFS